MLKLKIISMTCAILSVPAFVHCTVAVQQRKYVHLVTFDYLKENTKFLLDNFRQTVSRFSWNPPVKIYQIFTTGIQWLFITWTRCANIIVLIFLLYVRQFLHCVGYAVLNILKQAFIYGIYREEGFIIFSRDKCTTYITHI